MCRLESLSSPRAGCMCSRRPPDGVGRPAPGRRDDQSLEPQRYQSGGCGRHRHSYRQLRCAVMSRAPGTRTGRLGSSTAGSTRRCFRRNPANTAPRTRRQGRRGLMWAKVVRDCLAGQPATIYDAGRVSARVSCRLGGICCLKAPTCGPRCRRCAAARSTARSVPCGAPTGRSRARARDAVVREVVELRRRGFRSSPWPTTISIR
jgi:hypothetical protein